MEHQAGGRVLPGRPMGGKPNRKGGGGGDDLAVAAGGGGGGGDAAALAVGLPARRLVSALRRLVGTLELKVMASVACCTMERMVETLAPGWACSAIATTPATCSSGSQNQAMESDVAGAQL